MASDNELTNEELATKIQTSSLKDNDSIEKLWNNIKKFVYQQANKYYIAHESIIPESQIDFVDDAIQESFLQMLKAVATYNDENCLFLTWYGYYLKTAFRIATGIRSEADYNQHGFELEMQRLDAPIDNDDGSTLLDLVDLSSDDVYQEIDNSIYNEKLHELLKAFIEKALPLSKQKIINYRYFDNMTFRQIADALDMTTSTAQRKHNESITTLRRKIDSIQSGKEVERYIDFYTNFYNNEDVAIKVYRREEMRKSLTNNNNT